MLFFKIMILAVLGALLLIDITKGHPQCLDYEPPFTPTGHFDICLEYNKFGCCNSDEHVFVKYLQVINSYPAEDVLNCHEYVKDILCQECSPYAAHLFDAESSRMPKTFPNLCSPYYDSFLSQCSQFLSSFTTVPINRTRSMQYCYPDVVQNDTLLNNLGTIGVQNSDNCLNLCVKEVANDLYTPTSAKHAGDGTQRMFVVEQRGYVWVFLANFSKLSVPFLDISSNVFSSGRSFDERGLLDIEFHPNFKSNGLFYVYYTNRFNSKLIVRISEFTISSTDMNRADMSTERVIMQIPQPASNHNGGSMLYLDGYLYIFTGDGGRGGDPWGNAQNRSSLLGKALRIDVNLNLGGRRYSTPHDNPFTDSITFRHEIFAYGLRNPWRCSADRGDRATGSGQGRIFCADVGQDRVEEIDIIVKGGNYGWNHYEGNNCFKKCSSLREGEHVRPIAQYRHSVGKSVTGGYVYRGCKYPNLQGKYVFGDWSNGKLFLLRENEDGIWTRQNICMAGEGVCVNGGLSNSYARYINAFAENENGELFMLNTRFAGQNNHDGRIYQIVDPSRRGNPITCRDTPPRIVPIHQGTSILPYTPIQEIVIEIRLIPSKFSKKAGRIEIRQPGQPWGTICDDFWNINAARVACRQLGFRFGIRAPRGAHFGEGKGPIWLDDVRCTGRESSLIQCRHRGWNVTNCSHNEDASVVCR